ncbi:MAG: hypothetical protein HC837_04390 [Chloroflexaceae bacterium]|nr:hypothetical protein [Chloroflexaceae bacterium]
MVPLILMSMVLLFLLLVLVVLVFSPNARAQRARAAGRLSVALQIYVRRHAPAQVVACLQEDLPSWPVRAQLILAFEELIQLETSAQVALAAGAPQAFATSFTDVSQHALENLLQTADRLWAVAVQRVDYAVLQQGLEREDERLQRLVGAIRRAREELALITLADAHAADFDHVTDHLRLLADMARHDRGGQQIEAVSEWLNQG